MQRRGHDDVGGAEARRREEVRALRERRPHVVEDRPNGVLDSSFDVVRNVVLLHEEANRHRGRRRQRSAYAAWDERGQHLCLRPLVREEALHEPCTPDPQDALPGVDPPGNLRVLIAREE